MADEATRGCWLGKLQGRQELFGLHRQYGVVAVDLPCRGNPVVCVQTDRVPHKGIHKDYYILLDDAGHSDVWSSLHWLVLYLTKVTSACPLSSCRSSLQGRLLRQIPWQGLIGPLEIDLSPHKPCLVHPGSPFMRDMHVDLIGRFIKDTTSCHQSHLALTKQRRNVAHSPSLLG